MFNVIFYEDKNGHSDIKKEIDELKSSSNNNKSHRIQLKQIVLYIELLANRGLNMPVNIVKHITKEIWELRPGNNRILYFYFKDNTFVLLHMFKKKTQKTPKSEIERAIRECNDYKERNGGR